MSAPTLFEPVFEDSALGVFAGTNWIGFAIAAGALLAVMAVGYVVFVLPRRTSPGERARRHMVKHLGLGEGDQRALARLAKLADCTPAALLLVPTAFRRAAERLVEDDPKAATPVAKLAQRAGFVA